ncbi:hypothetical protein [Gloeothece verrucosa]|uniref:DUF4276 family protein n=1 Tax=Gloeothece verrucosa (strain PCC 7822) TaxID=497965 RepID=E0U909_GLOV7|nr:hypothetical protein [Gloeothece verrucosa]ADN16148.1 conserved hypothetical protein [Gloeothece verrucosa PCC 7822]
MNVLIIPEDFSKDQYILKPIIEALFKYLGLESTKVKVRVCQDPRLAGYVEALKWERIEKIINRYKSKIDIFILCVDRDGNEPRKKILDNLEEQAANILGTDQLFVAENAWQEVEVWLLAGH